MAPHMTNTMTRDRRCSRTPMFNKSCSETDKDMWCKRIGIVIIAIGSALVIAMSVYWALTTTLHPKFPVVTVSGFILCVTGYLLHGYYGSKIKAMKRQQEGQESEVGQTSARATNAAVLTLLTHPHNELDENLVSNAYRSNPTALSTNYNMSNEQPQSGNSQSSSAMIFNNSEASDRSRQQPVVAYTLLDNTTDSPMTQDVNGSQLQHLTTAHTVLDIREASVPEPHSGSVNHEGVSIFHTERHTSGHSDSPQRLLSTTAPLCPSNIHHHVVTSDHLESPSQEGQRIQSPDDDDPPSYDAVMRYSYLYKVLSS